jgi:hypothetical protein
VRTAGSCRKGQLDPSPTSSNTRTGE